jgi:hypothetical protein
MRCVVQQVEELRVKASSDPAAAAALREAELKLKEYVRRGGGGYCVSFRSLC